MTLFFTTIDMHGQAQAFCCSDDNMELATAVLNEISLRGNPLISIELIDTNQCIPLTVDAFNDKVLLSAVQPVKKEGIRSSTGFSCLN